MRLGQQRWWLLGAMSALPFIGPGAAQPAAVPLGGQAPIWDLRRPPLARLELMSPGPHEVQRTLVGFYADERVCYLESVELGFATLRFAAGSAAPLPKQELWAKSVAEVTRSLPETQPLWVIGHAEPIEAPTPALAAALSGQRAEAARALLVTHGLKAERLLVRARGSGESALLRGEPPHEVAQWRRVSVQTEDKPSQHGARLIHVRGDQRPMLAWMLAVQQASAQQPGREPVEVGPHVPRYRIQFDKEALKSLGRLPPIEEGQPADLRALHRLVDELTSSDCQISHTTVPKRE